MPLLNMIAMCGDTNPVVVSICDCTDHMSEGGKKMSPTLLKWFKRVNEFNPKGQNTDVFYFDEAANVQLAGQFLCQTFHKAYCFHGGEHILSLFFSDLSNLKNLQVWQSNFFIC